jgi:xylulose-5-phosphate/fructose-6-phosphate phosphoketolase
METVAAAWWLRHNVPDLKVRVVNVVDLMTLFPPAVHPHGMNEGDFVNLFTADTHVIFAFHGYARAMHQILHGRANPERFHVRGFIEQGTTTTPFDMLMLNKASRYDLINDVANNVPKLRGRRAEINDLCDSLITRARAYTLEHLEDPPEITNWVWTD